MAKNLLCRATWHEAFNDPPASASQMLELQVCVTMSGNKTDFLFINASVTRLQEKEYQQVSLTLCLVHENLQEDTA